MSVTAVITVPVDGSLGDSGTENPYHVAGYTVEQFSSDTSTATGGDTKVVHTTWSADDGWTDTGRQVQHRFDTAGVHTVTCTVTGDGGGTNSTTKQITSVAFAPTFEKFVKVGGSDAANGNSDGTAYASIEKAFDQWVNLGSDSSRKGVMGAIWVKRGDTIPSVTPDGTHSASPDHGFLVIAPYGSGAKPIWSLADGRSVECNAGGHVPDEWGWAVYFKDITCTWATRNESNTIGLGNPGSQWDGCDCTNGFIAASGTFGRAFIDGSVTLSGKSGLFPSSNWCILDNISITLNCLNDVNAQHQVYGSAGLNHWVYRRLTVVGDDQGNDGLRSVSARIGYVADCTVTSIFNSGDAYFPGANNIGDRHSSAYIGERVVASAMNSGWNFNSTDDAVLKNFIAKGGTGSWAVRVASLNATDKADNVRLYHGVFYGNTSRDLLTDDVATNIVLKNCIVMRTDSSALLEIGDSTKITSDYNCFWRVGGTPDADATFAIVGGVTKTFAQWKALGQDTHSIFKDPKFTNAAGGDFSFQASSPCIGMAPKLGEVPFDYSSAARGSLTAPGIFDGGSGGGGSGGSGSSSVAGNDHGAMAALNLAKKIRRERRVMSLGLLPNPRR